jgi:hypothetical protein
MLWTTKSAPEGKEYFTPQDILLTTSLSTPFLFGTRVGVALKKMHNKILQKSFSHTLYDVSLYIPFSPFHIAVSQRNMGKMHFYKDESICYKRVLIYLALKYISLGVEAKFKDSSLSLIYGARLTVGDEHKCSFSFGKNDNLLSGGVHLFIKGEAGTSFGIDYACIKPNKEFELCHSFSLYLLW